MFNNYTTGNVVLTGHPGCLLNDTFRDPTSDALQKFTNIGTIIGYKVYSIIYYSPVYNTICLQIIKSFDVIPLNSSAANAAVSTPTSILSSLYIIGKDRKNGRDGLV
jgi:hypothetical protein